MTFRRLLARFDRSLRRRERPVSRVKRKPTSPARNDVIDAKRSSRCRIRLSAAWNLRACATSPLLDTRLIDDLCPAVAFTLDDDCDFGGLVGNYFSVEFTEAFAYIS
jgi:hypothetical protein